LEEVEEVPLDIPEMVVLVAQDVPVSCTTLEQMEVAVLEVAVGVAVGVQPSLLVTHAVATISIIMEELVGEYRFLAKELAVPAVLAV
jgi:hypothetical protein